MSTRTLIEINHDTLPEALERLVELTHDLRHMSERELRERYNGLHGVRFLAQRHHSGPFYLTRRDSALFAHDVVIDEKPHARGDSR